VRFGEQLGLPGLEVTAGGCLGNCGNGPNLVLLPQGTVLRHVTTPANLAHALRAFCGAAVSDDVSGGRGLCVGQGAGATRRTRARRAALERPGV
jgi:(2Fe-2S) ferredoxin